MTPTIGHNGSPPIVSGTVLQQIEAIVDSDLTATKKLALIKIRLRVDKRSLDGAGGGEALGYGERGLEAVEGSREIALGDEHVADLGVSDRQITLPSGVVGSAVVRRSTAA
jgi:hypothetical protein